MGHAVLLAQRLIPRSDLLKQNYNKVHPIMFIASCTSIIWILTARQDDGRAVTVSVIPLTLPANSQPLGYQFIPSPDGIFGSFSPTLRWAATSQQLTSKGLQQERIWTPCPAKRLNGDDQNMHAEAHRYHRGAVYIVSSHFRSSSCWKLSKCILHSERIRL